MKKKKQKKSLVTDLYFDNTCIHRPPSKLT